MIGNARLMKCGACGGEEFRIYHVAGKDDFPTCLMCECQKCKSTSTITVPSPTMVIGWGDESEGVLSVF